VATSDAPGLALLVAPVHRAVAHEVSRLAEVVGNVPDGDARAARALGTWAFDVVDLLHHHLRGVATIRSVLSGDDDEAVREAVRAGDRDHRSLASEVALAMGAAVRWQDGAPGRDRDALAAHLSRLRSGTAVAFRRIEGDLAAAADRLVPAEDRVRAAAHAASAFRGRRGLALTGAVLAASAGASPPTSSAASAAAASSAASTAGSSGGRLRRVLAQRQYRRRTALLERLVSTTGA
jgi:hypothetical protein